MNTRSLHCVWIVALLAGGVALADDPAAVSTLRVVSYNIKHGEGTDSQVDLSRAATVLKRLNPDLVGLQEVDERVDRSGGVDQAAELGKRLNPDLVGLQEVDERVDRSGGVDQAAELGKRLGMHHAFGSFMDYQGGRYGLAILSRFPLEQVQVIELPRGNEPRVALAVTTRLPGGQSVQLVNVHFDWVGDDGFRYAQAERVRRHLDQVNTPVLLVGDFNDQPGSRTLQLLGDPMLQATKPADDRFTFSSTDPRIEIDFIFAAPAASWTLRSTEVIDESVASDHRPVVAEFVLTGDAGSRDAGSREAAEAAMHRAVKFFTQQAAVHGGYVFRRSADLSLAEGESKVGSSTAWIEPPATPGVGMAYLNAYRWTGDPLLLDAARQTATALIQGQLVSGGWTEQIEFAPQDRRRFAYRVDGGDVGKRHNTTTFDDDKTQSALRFLMQLDHTLQGQDPTLREAVRYGLDAAVRSQYPNGAWPQRYSEFPDPDQYPVHRAAYPASWSRQFPAAKYAAHYTLNDGTHSDLVTTMLDAWDIYGDQRYWDAAEAAAEFLIRAQMPEPQPGWAQQYDLQMHPSWARKFEPPAISGGESQSAMRTLILMYRRTGHQRYRDAVGRALQYFQRCLLPDGRLARFYELQTNRPLYFTRDYQLTYTADDLPTHYGFIVKSSLDRIERELAEAIRDNPASGGVRQPPANSRPPKASDKLAKAASQAVAALDPRGAWVESGKLKTHPVTPGDQIISSETFIDNLTTLAAYLTTAGDER